ncbi:MAG: phage capsid protein [Oscillospiraceae bacterium]|nr:phage capsid protein [Oscillospiraceae bacterium]
MLTPEQIQKIADTMFPMLDSLNARILRDMIKRLAARIGRGEANMLTATDEWQAQVYQESGGLLEDVQREIQQFLQASDEEMARIFEDAAIKSLEADNRVYVQAGDKARSLSPAMLRVLTDAYQRTKGTIHNFTRTTAAETQKEFVRLLDEAHLRVMNGAGAYTQAVSDVMRELSETQTQVLYPSGHVDTIEVAVLRAVRTGTAQAAGNMSLTDMEERDWDLIRVSAHIGARYGDGGENPGNHFWWQGKLYSKSGQDKRYPPFVEATGYGTGEGLCGWNCRHSFGPGDPNHNPYKDFDAEENKKAYDLSQKQREMERRIRHTKTKLIALREGIEATEDAGVKAPLETEYAKTAKLLERRNVAYRDFCKENNLKPLSERIEVAKWTRADTRKSFAAVKESSPFDELKEYSGKITVVEAFSGKDYVVKIDQIPTISGVTKHFSENLAQKADRAGLTLEAAQSIINNNRLILYQSERKTLKFLADNGYAVLNLQNQLVTAVPEKLRKKYRDYLEAGQNGAKS